jgi:DNA-binding beta-propeller fold protein YncE
MVTEVPFDAPRPVTDAIQSLGRTEDVSFSPDNRRLAIAAFTESRILVLDVAIDSSADGMRIALTGGAQLTSPDLQHPHGVDFVDDRTLIVTNRDGAVVLMSVPAGSPTVPSIQPTTLGAWRSGPTMPLDAPGSVWVHGNGTLDVLICNNEGHTVTRHVLNGHDTAPSRTDVLLHRYLDIPDSVSVSGDGRWLAVSNHTSHDVFVYPYSAAAIENAQPQGILQGVRYPHGLCFGPDGRSLFVADAGAPLIHIFAADDQGWAGLRSANATLQVMNDETYAKAAHTPESGGPKGLDIDGGGHVAAITSEAQPLAFFSVSAMLERLRPGAIAADLDAGRFGHALWRIETGNEAARRARNLRLDLHHVRTSTSWRITEPLRWAHAVLKRLR